MTRKITPAQLDEIEAAARAATDGPWSVVRDDEIDSPEGPLLAGLLVGDCGVVRWTHDAIHIAAFDPPTALALIAEVREWRAKVERATTIARRFDKRDPMWRDMHYAAKVMRALEEEV